MKTSDPQQVTGPNAPCRMMQNDLTPAEDRVTIIAPSYFEAALEFHRRRMAEKGYRLEYRIEKQQLFLTDGNALSPLFDGKTMYLASFVRQDRA